MVCKDDVVDWFKGLSASNRIDTMCTLMDSCLSFELRFLGTVIENLGRRDFHELRDAGYKANSFLVDNANDRIAILNFLSEPPIASIANSNCHYNVHHQNPSANSFNQSSHHNFHNNVVNDTSTNRPSPTHTTERKPRSPGPGGQTLPPPSHATESHIPSIGALQSSSESSCVTAGNKTGHHMTSGNANPTSAITNCRGNGGGDEEDECKSDTSILTDDIRRRKLITYLSLLNATNRDCAKAYFGVLSEIKDVLSVIGWIDGLDERTLEEMALLFTIGNNHPAFTFEQRSFLGDIMLKFQSQIAKIDNAVGKNYPQTFVIPQANNYYFLPHYVSPGQAPPGNNNQAPENGRILAFTPYLQMMMPYHPQVPISQQTAHPYAQNLVGAANSPQAAAGSPVTPTQTLIQQQSVPLSGPSSSSSSSSVQQFPKPQQAASQSQQSSVSTPTRTSSMASAVTAFQSQTNSLDGNESEECAWDSPESSPFESPPQSLTPSRSDSPTASQTNTVTQSSVSSPTLSTPHSSLPLVSNSSCGSQSSGGTVIENLCSTTSIASAVGSGSSSSSIVGVNAGRSNKLGTHAPIPLPVMHGQEVAGSTKTLSMGMSMNGLKITMPERRPSKLLSNSMSYHSQNSAPNQLSSMLPLSGASTSGPPSSTHGMAMTPSVSNNPSSSQHSCHSQPYVHSSQSQPVNNGGYSSGNSTSITNVSAAASLRTVSVSSMPITSIINSGNSRSSNVSASAYNHSISVSSYHHPVAMPIPQPHHPQSNANCEGSNQVYGNTLKGCTPLQSHTRLKSVNSGSNPSNAMNSSTMLPSQQMMGQVQNPPPSVVNSVGVATHSISTNPSLVAYPHGPLNHGGPPVNNYGGVAGYSNVGAPPFSSMGFRSPNNQQTLINRAAGYIPQHSNSMINNQMVMKQQDQRSHNLNPNMSHGRPKANNSSVQAQNTPKRRNNGNSSSNASNSNSNGGSNGGNQHLQNKGEDTTEKDRANGVPVVSANPMKSSQQQQDRVKGYHHQVSGMPMSNGPLGTVGNSSNSSGISSNSGTPNSVVLNSNSGQGVGNISVNTGPAGSQVLHCAASKTDENIIGDGLLEYPVSTPITSLPAYAGGPHMFGHGPGGTAYVAINGFLPPYYSPSVVSSGSQQAPPSTEIMANPTPGHAYNFPFTIPQYHPQQMANKAGSGTNSVVSKDLNKIGAADSKMMGLNDLCIAYGRNIAGPVPQSTTPINAPLMTYPMVSPGLPQQPRGRYIQDVVAGNDMAMSGIEPMLPPLEDPVDLNMQRRLSCYNCGAQTHLGPECKETSIEEMTRHPYRLNYNPQPSPNSPSDQKDE